MAEIGLVMNKNSFYQVKKMKNSIIQISLAQFWWSSNKEDCLIQRRLDPGKETLEGFFQVGSLKEYQNVVIISFVYLEKINIFLFYAQECSTKIEPATSSWKSKFKWP